jgi:hypothetical protein
MPVSRGQRTSARGESVVCVIYSARSTSHRRRFITTSLSRVNPPCPQVPIWRSGLEAHLARSSNIRPQLRAARQLPLTIFVGLPRGRGKPSRRARPPPGRCRAAGGLAMQLDLLAACQRVPLLRPVVARRRPLRPAETVKAEKKSRARAYQSRRIYRRIWAGVSY